MKKVLSLIMILFVLSTSLLVACKKDTYQEEFIKGGVIELYTEKELNLLSINTDNYTITCEQPDVLVITGKTAFAKKIGTATIIVETEEKKFTQQVQVIDSVNKPEILIDDVSLTVGASYKLAPETTYKLDKVEGVTYEYSIDNSSVAEIKDGRITAKALGTANVTVTAIYNGIKGYASKNIVCRVNELSGIELNRGEFELFIRNDVDGNKFDNELSIEADVIVNGQKVEGAIVEWEIADTTIASYADGEVSALKVGETTIKGTYTGADGKVLKTKDLKVEVKIPVVEIENPQLMDLGLDAQTFASEKVFVDATQKISYVLIDGKEYALTDNALSTTGFTAGEYECVFYNTDKTYGYMMQLVIADFVVYEASQIAEMPYHDTEYIALANDIDYGVFKDEREHIESKYRKEGLFVSPMKPIGKGVIGGTAFNGTLNGMGHAISNINFYGSGLFPTLQDCTIKNIAIVNALFTDYNAACFGYTCIGRTIIDNVYVDGDCTTSQYQAGLVEEVHRAGIVDISNTIVRVGISSNDANIIAGASKDTGIICCRLTGSVEVENSYFFSETQLLCSEVAHANNINHKFLNMLNCLFETEADYQMELNNEDGMIDYTNFNGYWDFSGIVPQFKTLG